MIRSITRQPKRFTLCLVFENCNLHQSGKLVSSVFPPLSNQGRQAKTSKLPNTVTQHGNSSQLSANQEPKCYFISLFLAARSSHQRANRMVRESRGRDLRHELRSVQRSAAHSGKLDSGGQGQASGSPSCARGNRDEAAGEGQGCGGHPTGRAEGTGLANHHRGRDPPTTQAPF